VNDQGQRFCAVLEVQINALVNDKKRATLVELSQPLLLAAIGIVIILFANGHVRLLGKSVMLNLLGPATNLLAVR